MNKKSVYTRLAVITVGALAIAGISVAGSSATATHSVTNNLGAGGGAYVSQYGNANFNFKVMGIKVETATITNTGGHVTWNGAKSWKFTGVPATYLYANGAGTITGTGTLTYFSTQVKGKGASTQKKGNHGNGRQDNGSQSKGGRWLSATTGIANFTIKYTRVINADGTIGKVDTFAIGFTGTASAGAPQLPALGALVQVKGGGDASNG